MCWIAYPATCREGMVRELLGKPGDQSCLKGALNMTARTTHRNAAPAAVAMTAEQFAQLGEGEVAYLKLMKSEDIRAVFPEAPNLQPGLKLFALLSADGSPILLADTKAAALANAWEHELQTVSVH
jgi:hypothetical protein